MILRLKPVTLRCNRCFHKFEKDNGDFEYTSECVAFRSMGSEFLHNWRISYEPCQKCGNRYSVNIDFYEYPADCLNYHDTETNAVSFMSPITDDSVEGVEDE